MSVFTPPRRWSVPITNRRPNTSVPTIGDRDAAATLDQGRLIRGARVLRDATGGGQPGSRDEVLALLQAHKTSLAQRPGVADLALFGSFALDRAGDNSNVDILVRFDGRATSQRYSDTQFYIEELLGAVSICSDGALRRELRPYVERGAIPWRTIIGTHNRLIHGYLGIENDAVWDIVGNDVSVLLASLRELLETTGSD